MQYHRIAVRLSMKIGPGEKLMGKNGNIIMTIVIMSIMLAGCEATSDIPEREETSEVPPTLLSEDFAEPTIITTEWEDTIVILPDSSATPGVQCPAFVGDGADSLLGNGSILFFYKRDPDREGLVAYFSTSKMSETIYQNFLRNFSYVVSPNNLYLAYRDFDRDELVIYAFNSGEEERVEWAESWKYLLSWSESRGIILLADQRYYDREAKEWDLEYLDPILYTRTEEKIHLDLPGTYIGPGMSDVGGYISPDEQNERVLYSAWGLEGIDVVFRDMVSEEDLWRYEGDAYRIPWPVPDWTEDESKLLLVLNKEETGFDQLFSLNRDGTELTALHDEPFDDSSCCPVRAMGWSPDAQYVLVSLWHSVVRGPGYLVDVNRKEILDICEPLLTEWYWIPGTDKVVYWVGNDSFFGVGEDESQIIILDIGKWEKQILVTEPFETRFEIVGWTPVEDFAEVGE